MKSLLSWFVILVSITLLVSSCVEPEEESSTASTDSSTSSPGDSSDNSSTSCPEFTFNNNLHSSLPNEWVEQFKIIMVNLDKVTPVKTTSYFCSLDIYAWLDITDKPFKDKIGNTGGTSISGNKNGRFMVLEMPSSEFTYNSIHRYSVIPHEYFHVYQLSLSKNMYDGVFDIKWLIEGTAATFESLYTQQYYSINYFKDAQTRVNIAVMNNPNIFESYKNSRDEDMNYSSSVFMVLALVNELKKLNLSE